MRGSEVRFHADAGDMAALFDAFNRVGGLSYVKTLGAIGAPLQVFEDAFALLGHLRDRHPQAPGVFAITFSGTVITPTRIVMQDGSGVKLAVNQPCNPDAVLIRLGGQLPHDRTLIEMSINTTAESLASKRLFKTLKALVVKPARYWRGYYVLPGALAKLQAGWRLTPSPDCARSEDLTLPEP